MLYLEEIVEDARAVIQNILLNIQDEEERKKRLSQIYDWIVEQVMKSEEANEWAENLVYDYFEPLGIEPYSKDWQQLVEKLKKLLAVTIAKRVLSQFV